MSCSRLVTALAVSFIFPSIVFGQEVPAARSDPGVVGRATMPTEDKDPSEDRGRIMSPHERDREILSGVTVGAVHVTGASNIAPAKFAAAIAPFVGRTFSGDDTQDLLSAISGVARKEGYIFATSRIPPQKLAFGVLTIELAEGRIDEVRLTGDQQQEVSHRLAPLVGQPAREEYLDQLLMAASDIPGVSIGKLRYSVESGKGVLIVPVSYDRIKAWAMIDNRGSKALGPVRVQLGAEVAALLAADDRVTVQGVVTPTHPGELTVLHGRYGYIFPGSSTELAISTTYSRTDAGGRWQSYDPRGNSIGFNASITKAIKRGRYDSLWASLDFNYIKVNQWWVGSQSQRDRVASANISLNGYTPVAGGRLRAGASLSKGLTVFGATEQGDPLASRAGAGSDYIVIRTWANWVGNLAGPVSARFAVTSQLSSDPLLAIDQISIGGPYFGRGYDFNERAGDEGVLASGELRTGVFDRDSGPLRWAQIYAFADAGVVTDLSDSYGTGDLYSAGIGARIKLARELRFEVEAAFPINEPRYDTADKRPRISATLGISL